MEQLFPARGFLPLTCSDFPGRIAAAVFFGGCNLRCGYCHNPHLVLPEKLNDIPCLERDYVTGLIKKRKRWIDGVVISGGEPCMHPCMVDFLSWIRSLDLKICLETNGHFPDILEEMAEKRLLDFVAMDIKGPLDNGFYRGVAGPGANADLVRQSADIIIASGLDHQFRMTVVPGLHTKEMAVELCREFGPSFRTQRFKSSVTLNKEFSSLEEYSEEEMITWPGYRDA